MFRKIKKKPAAKNTLRTTTVALEEEDGDETPAPTLLKRNKQNANSRVVRSFDEEAPRKKIKLGFGGLAAPVDVETSTDVVEEEESTTKTRSYDTNSLSQLQAEQKRYVPKELEPERQEQPVSLSTEEDYISLREDGPTVLTGEEALRHFQAASFSLSPLEAAGEGQTKLDVDSSIMMEEDEEAANDWEAQVTRRAGYEAAPSSIDSSSSSGKKYLSIEQLKDRIEPTIQQLKTQQGDLERAHQRRQAEANQCREELDRRNGELQESGEAVEFYQLLRQKLADWVGALRQLQSKTIPIQKALHDLEAEVASNKRQREWEDDMIAILFQNELLDHVEGRQPDSSVYDPLMTFTDEFGRDTKSHSVIQRELRARHRQRIYEQRSTVRGDESDAFLTDDEKETFRERHDALQQALQVALGEIDEEFTSLQNVMDVFADWKKRYPEDYRQCYASISCADLAIVLIQAELCALNDPWNESGGYNEGKWIAVVHDALEKQVLDDAAVERILEKAVFPSISDLLLRSGYNLISYRQARALASFFGHVQKVTKRESNALDKLRQTVIAYVRKQLNDIAMPIVRKGIVVEEMTNKSEQINEALEGATSSQVLRTKKIMVNLLEVWAPVLAVNDSFVEVLLDFLSTKFLYLLSSLRDQDIVRIHQSKFSESPGDAFCAVWEKLEQTSWLDDARWMLQAAPLRAAASVYECSRYASS